jgi:hypothetical protein
VLEHLHVLLARCSELVSDYIKRSAMNGVVEAGAVETEALGLYL